MVFFLQAEIIFLGQLRHSHLVKLIGCCCEEDQRLLVYEYMPRGSLENQLFRSMLLGLLFFFHGIFPGKNDLIPFFFLTDKTLINQDCRQRLIKFVEISVTCIKRSRVEQILEERKDGSHHVFFGHFKTYCEGLWDF